MVTFRNNNRRHRFRSNDRFKKNNDLNKIKFKSESNASGFQRKIQIGRNGQNLPKLIEKYNNLAREAIANEDKIVQAIADKVASGESTSSADYVHTQVR